MGDLIDARDLVTAYNQCKHLNDFLREKGNDLLLSLHDTIKNLKSHWVSSDGTIHINNLINLYDYLGRLIEASLVVASTAGNSVVKIQELNRMNGGFGDVGIHFSPNFIYRRIAFAEQTSRYFVAPQALKDKNDLYTICSSYNSLITSIKNQTDDLFANWLTGANKEKIQSEFNDVFVLSDKYKSILELAYNNLDKATTNITIVSGK